MKLAAFAALAAIVLGSCATAAHDNTPPPQFTTISENASVSVSSVQDRGWGRDNSVLLRTYHGDWYRAVLVGGCTNAGSIAPVGFAPATAGFVDRGASIIVGGQGCRIASFSKIEPPPPGSRR